MKVSREKMIELVQGQMEAYNSGDIHKFASFYHSDITAFRLPFGEPFVQGLEQFKVIYSKRFKSNPKLYCELKSRVVLEQSIIDEEWVTGEVSKDQPSHVAAVYQFKDDLIHTVWFTY
jgi:hypothetical protein